MGAIARVIQSENGDDEEIIQTVEAHYGENKYCDQYAPSGEDAPPLPEDRVALVNVEGTGNAVSVGVLAKSQGAKPGEKLIYSRDENGNVTSVIHLKNDGSVEFSSNKDVDLKIKGKVSVTIDGDAEINVKGDAKLSATKFSVNNGNLEVT